jgi:cytochrome c oxidase subunit 2
MLLPGVALAQDAPVSQSAAEAATAIKPVLDPATSLAPAGATAAADGQGSNSAQQAAATEAAPGKTMPDPAFGLPRGGWQFQEPVTEIGQYGRWFNDALLLPLMTVVSIIVVALLAYAAFRFRESRNPVASKTSHNTLIEVIWTAVPVLILVVIAVPSFRLLADQYDPPKPDLTIKAVGHQWYWAYEYPDHGDLGFDAVMLTDQEAADQGLPRLLETDNRVVVPAGATVKVLVTAADVLHSWAVPAFWVKMDAVPGRINETWFKVDRPGVYYGQCSELCGTKHGFMPITVEVVTPEKFNEWMAAKQAADGIEPTGPRYASGAGGKLVTVAAAPASAPAPAAAAPAPAVPAPAAAPAPASI